MAQVYLEDDTRDELRRYKAEYGLTYSDAIERLLNESGWYDEQ
jgi:antitoxin component of RelBE/YafQ-DinJ toxin-antitoxin module